MLPVYRVVCITVRLSCIYSEPFCRLPTPTTETGQKLDTGVVIFYMSLTPGFNKLWTLFFCWIDSLDQVNRFRFDAMEVCNRPNPLTKDNLNFGLLSETYCLYSVTR